jgi:glutamate carboxypeptidase
MSSTRSGAGSLDSAWVASAVTEIAARAERELEALVGVSSPSGDAAGAEEAVAVTAALLPPAATVERLPCSTADHAPDLLARLAGTGSGRILLLGHLDTVHAHSEHRALTAEGDRLYGSGATDMKAGIVLALGVLRALAASPGAYEEVDLLAVNDEEWRVGQFAHGERFAGHDACLCFEAGELADGDDAVVVRRKAAGTLRVRAHGVAAHSGSAPERGSNALLALAEAAARIAELNDPGGSERLTAVPTVLHSGDAFNVVPAAGELVCDLRADTLAAFDPVLGAVPSGRDGVAVEAEIVRRWPGMDTRERTSALLARAAAILGRPLAGGERGGASDASHLSAHVALTVDGLGPLGGGAHTGDEHVLGSSIPPRAEVALALVAAALAEP